MTKEEFRKLIVENGKLAIGINEFDPAEISAVYTLDDMGQNQVYEVFDDGTLMLVGNVYDDAEMQKFEDEVLSYVVSHSLETNHFELCVAYIKANLEHWEIEKGWSYIGKRMGLPNELAGRIYDLIDEFTEDYELTDDWWNDYEVEDFFMEIDND